MFVLPAEQYTRDFDLKENYLKQMTIGLMRKYRIAYKEARVFIENELESKLINRDYYYVGRKSNGDREIRKKPILDFLMTVQKNNLICSPSMVVYKNPKVERSLTAVYIDVNVKKRKINKGLAFKARKEGNMSLFYYKNNEQNANKIKNNALSGAHASDSTILYLPSIHTTLTSTCRSASGYGNANNEKLLSGNRHYHHFNVIEAAILSAIEITNYKWLKEAVNKYNLKLPTTDEAMSVVYRSCEYYMYDPEKMYFIKELLGCLEPLERAAFVYVGDLYHLRKLNPEFLHKVIDELSDIKENVEDVSLEDYKDPMAIIGSMTEEEAVHVGIMTGEYIAGKSVYDYSQFTDKAKKVLLKTIEHVKSTTNKFSDFFRAFFLQKVMPVDVANLPMMFRRSAIASDTDSTIYTVQDWVNWFSDNLLFNQKNIAVSSAVSFISSSNIVHILAMMSGNIGVIPEKIFKYAMKSEYFFPIFIITTRGKTYAALRAAQEGVVFEKGKEELEIKGAPLKATAAPKKVSDYTKYLIEFILRELYSNRKIQLYDLLKDISMLELEVKRQILSGHESYFKSIEIKAPNSYKKGDPMQTPYENIIFWNATFAKIYGECPEAPTDMVKVSVDLDTPKKFLDWVESINNDELKKSLLKYVNVTGKKTRGMILIPKAVCNEIGIPTEIVPCTNIRTMIGQHFESIYIILESLAYFSIDGNQSRLVSDLEGILV